MINVSVNESDRMFLEEIAKSKHIKKSEIVKDLLDKGRILYAVNEYEQGKASLEKASKDIESVPLEAQEKSASIQSGVSFLLKVDEIKKETGSSL